jgi:hypothetical protein
MMMTRVHSLWSQWIPWERPHLAPAESALLAEVGLEVEVGAMEVKLG